MRTSPPAIRSLGGENDAPSRNISRWLDGLADDLSLGLDVRQIWRNDRFGRGGDHTEFLNAGFPAVRITVAIENYNWQHQDLRTENGIEYGDTIDKMDFPYLTKVVKLNVAALAALASAPPPPEPTVEGAVSTDTTLELGAGEGRRRLYRSLAAHRCRNWSDSLRIADAGCLTCHDAGSRPDGMPAYVGCSRASGSTIGCSASPRSRRTAMKARSPRRCRAAPSGPTRRRRRRPQ